jgi:lipoic acid synthetase
MRHPEWIKSSLQGRHGTKKVLRRYGVSTVCEEAMCPNQGKCFSRHTATFMILGDVCTRNCSFCAVTPGSPVPPDPDEPRRVAEAASELGLEFVVITSVTRDDLPDGGATQFARTISVIRETINNVKIEVLIPDFKGDYEALKVVLNAGPDVLNHNVETVPSLYGRVRPQADYRTSIELLRRAGEYSSTIRTKSGIMLGLGETEDEVIDVMADLRSAGCEFLTIGQYLQPRKNNLPVTEYIRPEVFEKYRLRGMEMGFRYVASAPLVRSSMDAGEYFEAGRAGKELSSKR